jgi:LacI family transcriptional regulator
MMKKRKVSMQSIADELKISKVTVSKALNDKEGVGEELKNKIKEAAARQGYIMPVQEETERKKIGIIMNGRFISEGGGGAIYMRMYEKIVRELGRYNYSTMMLTPSPATIYDDISMMKKENLFKGILVLGLLDQEVREQVKEIDIPKVYVDIYDRTHRSDSVVSENVYSMYDMTRYLIRMGHRKIGFVGTINSTTSITDRYLGFLRAMLEKNMQLRDDWVIPDRSMEGKAVDIELPKEMPTAFICNCDETAFRLTRTLNSHGYTVPDDISIGSFDDDIYAKLTDPQLTTVAVNASLIGKVSVRQIIERIEKPDKKPEIKRIEGEIIYRNSVKNLNLDGGESIEKRDKVENIK